MYTNIKYNISLLIKSTCLNPFRNNVEIAFIFGKRMRFILYKFITEQKNKFTKNKHIHEINFVILTLEGRKTKTYQAHSLIV